MTKQTKRAGITLVELLIALVCIAVVLCMALPFVSRGRYSMESARRATCINNLKNLALAAMLYESAHGEFPMGVGIKDQDGTLQETPVSGVVALLPYLEQQDLYNDIANPMVIGGTEYPAFETSLTDAAYPPWNVEIDLFRCPSATPGSSKFARTSYAFSLGDVARNISQQEKLRGAFGYFKALDTTDVSDGCSNTIGFVEIGGGSINTAQGGCLASGKKSWLDNPKEIFSSLNKWQYTSGTKLIDRGSHWADGRAGVGMANTILPVNSPSFQVQGSATADGIYSAGSMHAGGANVANLDGSVHFISDDIDTGGDAATLTAEQMADGVSSPHGVWGAAGTIAGEEELFLE